MIREREMGGCCSLPTDRASCALLAAGNAARRGSLRRGFTFVWLSPTWTDGNLYPVEGLRRGAVGAA